MNCKRGGAHLVFGGGSEKPVTFKIKPLNYDRGLWINECNKEPVLTIYVRVPLEGYSSEKNGLIYTDTRFERNLNKATKSLGFNGKFNYTEQGMQGNSYVSMTLDCPVEVIAPELYVSFKKIKKLKDAEKEQVKAKPKKKTHLEKMR